MELQLKRDTFTAMDEDRQGVNRTELSHQVSIWLDSKQMVFACMCVFLTALDIFLKKASEHNQHENAGRERERARERARDDLRVSASLRDVVNPPPSTPADEVVLLVGESLRVRAAGFRRWSCRRVGTSSTGGSSVRPVSSVRVRKWGLGMAVAIASASDAVDCVQTEG